MANIDRSIQVIFCPLCGTAKESDVYIEESDGELGPKFFCGTIGWPFQKTGEGAGREMPCPPKNAGAGCRRGFSQVS
jgi:hypothetical protein